MTRTEALTAIPVAATGFDPYTEQVRRDPYPFYRWLLEHDPVHRGARGLWYVARYADVKLVMSDRRFGRTGVRDYWTDVVGPGPLGEIMSLSIFYRDPPDHTRLRALVAPAFAPRVVDTLGGRITRIADELVDAAIERGEMDVIGDFAYPLPLIVICELLGIPAEDRAQFRAWTLDLAAAIDPVVPPEQIARGQTAMGEFAEYLRGLVAHRGVSGDDLLGSLMDGGRGRASVEEVISMAVTLIFAGHETTTHLIGNGLLALLRYPDQLARLREHPELTPRAVEECLRFDPPVGQNTREVQQDIEIAGRLLRRGEIVIGLRGAANRDPAKFADPHAFDIARSPNQHLSFGAGMRFCLGAPLARLEGRIALGTLVRRLSGIRLAVPEAELEYEPSTLFRGVTSLPIAFQAASAPTGATRRSRPPPR